MVRLLLPHPSSSLCCLQHNGRNNSVPKQLPCPYQEEEPPEVYPQDAPHQTQRVPDKGQPGKEECPGTVTPVEPLRLCPGLVIDPENLFYQEGTPVDTDSVGRQGTECVACRGHGQWKERFVSPNQQRHQEPFGPDGQ